GVDTNRCLLVLLYGSYRPCMELLFYARCTVCFWSGRSRSLSQSLARTSSLVSSAIASSCKWRAVDGSSRGGCAGAASDRLTHLCGGLAIHLCRVGYGWVCLVPFLLAALSRQSGRASSSQCKGARLHWCSFHEARWRHACSVASVAAQSQS